jgi:hypothetical protein
VSRILAVTQVTDETSRPPAHHLHEQSVDPPVAGHLRVKRGGQHLALAHRDGMPGGRRQQLDTRTDPLHPRRSDEHRMHRLVGTDKSGVPFKRVDLTSKSVAPQE